MQPEVEIFGALITGDTGTFRRLLGERPDLANARNENGDDLRVCASAAAVRKKVNEDIEKLAKTADEPDEAAYALLDRFLELRPRKQLQQLCKNAAYSIHGGILLRFEVGFCEPCPSLSRVPPVFKS